MGDIPYMSTERNGYMGFFESLVNTAANSAYSANKSKRMGGKTVDQWDREWQSIGMLRDVQGNIGHLNHYVGLYRAKLNGKVVYIGRAVEYNNGGLRKRLTDYVRRSESSRGTNSSHNMNTYKDQLYIEVLLIGTDEEAAQITKALEPMLIGKYRPNWNKQFM